MYHLATILTILFTFVARLGVFAQTEMTLSYDTTYDNADLSLSQFACSNGANGLETKGYTTLRSLPTFPNVGGVYAIGGWNSSSCGTCYAVTYNGVTVNILGVDRSTTGFTVSKEAMDTLTGGNAVEFGRIDVSFVDVAGSACGLKN